MISRKSKTVPFGKKILEGPPGSILANSFRGIMFDLGMDEDRYNALMERYVAKALRFAAKHENYAARAGLSAELMKAVQSWKTYVKGLQFLAAKECIFTVHLWHDRELGAHYPALTKHSVRFNVNDYENDSGDEDDDTALTGPGRVLGMLSETITVDLGLTQEDLDLRLNNYIKRAYVGTQRKNLASIRAGLQKELNKSCLTWKTFVKRLNVLGAVKFKVSLTMTHFTGKSTTHTSEPIVLGEILE